MPAPSWLMRTRPSIGLWCLALAYFAIAVISAFVVKGGQGHAQG
jgi:hypothetical protein